MGPVATRGEGVTWYLADPNGYFSIDAVQGTGGTDVAHATVTAALGAPDGTYPVTVRVVDATGAWGETTFNITIQQGDTGGQTSYEGDELLLKAPTPEAATVAKGGSFDIPTVTTANETGLRWTLKDPSGYFTIQETTGGDVRIHNARVLVSKDAKPGEYPVELEVTAINGGVSKTIKFTITVK